MYTFKQFAENNLKLFGADAQRVTTDELSKVFAELHHILSPSFSAFELVKALPAKETHGDVDILVYPELDVKSLLQNKLGSKLLKFSKNDRTNSFLYHSDVLNKNIHVDIVTSSDEESHATKRHYYSYNDFAAAVGVLAKKLHFKFGSEGFFKRFQDKRGIWHDILITKDLKLGMDILGLNNRLYNSIHNRDDIVNFISSSGLFSSEHFQTLNAKDKQAVGKRSGLDEIINKLRNLNKPAVITDEDAIFRSKYPELYKKVQGEKEKINAINYTVNRKYNGDWIINNFNIPPGPLVGRILKAINNTFGDNLDDVPEDQIKQFVNKFIGQV